QKLDSPKNPIGDFLGQVGGRSHDPIETKGDPGDAVEHLKMDVAGRGLFGVVNQALQNFRRGLFGGMHAMVYNHTVFTGIMPVDHADTFPAINPDAKPHFARRRPILSTPPNPNLPTKILRSACGLTLEWDGRWPRSYDAPDGSCLPPVPERSNKWAPFCE